MIWWTSQELLSIKQTCIMKIIIILFSSSKKVKNNQFTYGYFHDNKLFKDRTVKCKTGWEAHNWKLRWKLYLTAYAFKWNLFFVKIKMKNGFSAFFFSIKSPRINSTSFCWFGLSVVYFETTLDGWNVVLSLLIAWKEQTFVRGIIFFVPKVMLWKCLFVT